VKVEFRKSFTKDLKKRKTDKPLLERVKQVILEVEEAQGIHKINNLKKLKTITIESGLVTIASVWL